MRKRFRMLLALALSCILGCTAWWAWRQPPEPVYKGQRLSLWLDRYSMDYGEDAEEEHRSIQEADEALRHMGTNAIPFMVRMVSAHDSRLRNKLIDLFEKQRFVFVRFTSADELNRNAERAFWVLGTNASIAAPNLIKIYRQNISIHSQCSAASSLGSLGPAASNAIPLFLATAVNTNVNGVGWDAELDRDVRREAAMSALGRIHSQPQMIVPVLIRLLDDPEPEIRCSAACTLGAFGCDAKSAMPTLVQLFTDEPGFTISSNSRKTKFKRAIMNIETAVATAALGGR